MRLHEFDQSFMGNSPVFGTGNFEVFQLIRIATSDNGLLGDITDRSHLARAVHVFFHWFNRASRANSRRM